MGTRPGAGWWEGSGSTDRLWEEAGGALGVLWGCAVRDRGSQVQEELYRLSQRATPPCSKELGAEGLQSTRVPAGQEAAVRSCSSLATSPPIRRMEMPFAGPCGAGGRGHSSNRAGRVSYTRSPPRRGLILDHSSQRRVSSSSGRVPGDTECQTEPLASPPPA